MIKIKSLYNKNLVFFSCVVVCLFAFCRQVPALENAASDNFEFLKKKLVADGFDASEIKTIFSRPKVCFDIKSVYLFFIHNEGKLNYDQFVSKTSIKNAKKYQKKYNDELSRAQNATGVDNNIITAIILVETRLGRSTGRSNVLNTLSTMAALDNKRERNLLWNKVSKSGELTKDAFEKKADRKSKWAYKELKAFIQYTSREKIVPSTIYGSYAGAVGIAQFIPSSILAYAKDGNNDNQIDLFNHADAIFSIANYLNHFGWNPDIGKEKAAKVVYRYNHSSYYVHTILEIAELLKGNQ